MLEFWFSVAAGVGKLEGGAIIHSSDNNNGALAIRNGLPDRRYSGESVVWFGLALG